ncbi:hypothetical protein BC643_0365 [Mangrovibacterium diazotrophicum]|uniref:Tetratricopeptide repeat protein n=1 Tax=Mangrovibacterium diazotrophicum TaxID=1261403 RepID=A0A419W3L2_9BACT|nr:hypothetical protein BC643_0365 [Mangrovibacterium diazotrophicum]
MYVIICLILFFCFKYFRSKYQLNSLKEQAEYEIVKITEKLEESQSNPMYQLRLASIYMNICDLVKARQYFISALSLINNGHKLYLDGTLGYNQSENKIYLSNRDEIIGQVKLSISYTEKPLPWSRNTPKDYSSSPLFFLLVKGFGGQRHTF